MSPTAAAGVWQQVLVRSPLCHPARQPPPCLPSSLLPACVQLAADFLCRPFHCLVVCPRCCALLAASWRPTS